MAKSDISVNTRPGADHYAAAEKIIEFSSPVGGGLISFTVMPDDQLSVHVYRQDLTVQVSAGEPGQPVRYGNMRLDRALYQAAKAFATSYETRQQDPTGTDGDKDDGILLTSAQLREWAGLSRDLTRNELTALDECIPNSSIPDAIGTIVTEALGLTGPDDDEPGSTPGVNLDNQLYS